MKQHYNENCIRMNLICLKIALRCHFRFPSKALVKINSKKEYLKYRKLIFMRINLLITRNILKIASRYDLQRVNFYHTVFKDEIKESFKIAKKYYKDAIPFWKRAKKYALEASKIPITTDLSSMESQRYRIKTKDLDYDRIINNHIKRLDIKLKKITCNDFNLFNNKLPFKNLFTSKLSINNFFLNYLQLYYQQSLSFW